MNPSLPLVLASATDGSFSIDVGDLVYGEAASPPVPIKFHNLSAVPLQLFLKPSASLRQVSSSITFHSQPHAYSFDEFDDSVYSANNPSAFDDNLNLLYGDAMDTHTFSLPPNPHVILNMLLVPAARPCVRSLSENSDAQNRTAIAEHQKFLPFTGTVAVHDASSGVVVNELQIRGRTCESRLKPELDCLDFGRCHSGTWYFKDFTVWNMSEAPTLFCISTGLPLSPSLKFIDCESGSRVKNVQLHIGAHSHRRIRVAFSSHKGGDEEHWFSIENLRNSFDVAHIRVSAHITTEAVAEGIEVSCGSVLDFGDCYSSHPTFRDISLQNKLQERVEITLSSNRSDQVSYELINEWNSVHKVDGNMTGAPVSQAHETVLMSSETGGMGYTGAGDQADHDFSIPGDLGSVEASRNSVVSDHRAAFVGEANAVERRNLVEELALSSGQKRTVRVWYTPAAPSRPSGAGTSSFVGRLTAQIFQLIFRQSSEESRVVVAKSRVCESIVRLEKREMHLGDCNVLATYSAVAHLINCSDLPAHVSVRYLSQSVVAADHEIQINPRQSFDLMLTFVPREVNPEYSKEITIANLRNSRSKNCVFVLRSNIVDRQKISYVWPMSFSLHILSYVHICQATRLPVSSCR